MGLSCHLLRQKGCTDSSLTDGAAGLEAFLSHLLSPLPVCVYVCRCMGIGVPKGILQVSVLVRKNVGVGAFEGVCVCVCLVCIVCMCE